MSQPSDRVVRRRIIESEDAQEFQCEALASARRRQLPRPLPSSGPRRRSLELLDRCSGGCSATPIGENKAHPIRSGAGLGECARNFVTRYVRSWRLPGRNELRSDRSEEWIEFVRGAAQTLDLPLINLVDELRSIPYEDTSRLFFPSDMHYNEQGHNVVARAVAEELESLLAPATTD